MDLYADALVILRGCYNWGMDSIPLELPPPPEHWYRFGWRGFSLVLPDEWSLQLHHGMDKTGLLVFADLRAPRLEVRWRSPRSAEKALECAASRASGDTRLFVQPPRLYEFHFPTGTSAELVKIITDDFQRTLPQLGEHSDILWQVYGVAAWLPRAARFQSASLLPGQTKLTFKDRSSTVILGSLSLADRLLERKTLRQWAEESFPELAGQRDARWEEMPGETRLTVQTRRLLRRVTHRLTLRHDLQSNRLSYFQSTRSG